MSMYEQLSNLYANRLHTNVMHFGSMVVTYSEGDNCMTASERYRCMVMVGNSQFQLGHHRQAEAMLKKAVLYAKNLLKAKLVKSSDIYMDGMTEVDVKLLMSECHIATGSLSLALSVLESVSPKIRTAGLNMALGDLYRQTGMERQAVSVYKEVVKACPCAVDAAERLVELGVPGSEVAMLMSVNDAQPPDWLVTFVKGLAARYNLDYAGSVASFQQLEENTPLGRNHHLLTTLGETYYLAGDSRHALTTLQRVHEMEPNSVKGTDLLGTLYYTDKRVRDLEQLASAVVSITEKEPHPWILMGYYCHLSKRTTKAIYFAHKACSMNPSSVEGLLLKGNLLLELKKLQEAVLHFREAMQIAPHRFEPYEGLVECYLAMHRNIEAGTIANNAIKVMGQSARSLTLYASVLLKDTLDINKGKSFLEKAIKEDPYYLPAVFHLCDIYAKEKRPDRAIELLNRQVNVQSGCRVHDKLSEMHSKLYHHDEAKYHHSIAMKYASMGEAVDSKIGGDLTTVSGGGGPVAPGGSGALDGGNADSPGNVEVPPYDMEVEDINDSEGDVELSDLETIWSEGDISFSGQ